MTEGEAIRRLREQAGLTQKQLALKLGWPAEKQTTLSHLERDHRKDGMRIGEMVELERACQAAPCAILRLTGYLRDLDDMVARINADTSLDVSGRLAVVTLYLALIRQSD